MADIEAFRAYRPDLGRVGPLSAATCPPEPGTVPSGPWSAAHLLGPEAAATLRAWRREDAVYQDSARSLYVVEQEIPSGGQTFTQRGILCRVRLEGEPGEGPWLELLRATHWNVVPALAHFPDDEGTVASLLDRAVGRRPPLETGDPRGGKCRLWALSDQGAVTALRGAMGPQTLTWADGGAMHAQAVAYLLERQALGEAEEESAPARFLMALLVGATEPGPARTPLAGLAYHSLRAN